MVEAVKTEAADAPAPDAEVKVEGKMAEFVSWIETISVLELSQLVKALEQRGCFSRSAHGCDAYGSGCIRRW